MAKSDNLRKAKAQKNDEFYTRLEDIEAEISQHEDYVRQFQGKTVFCNCDDPEWSNFFVFFKLHFKQLGLKKLITTHYNADGSPSYKIEWSGEMLNDDMVNLIKTPLEGNGDFRSEECIEILKEADIVVTNPPFSLFREYVAQLEEHHKQFVILGNQNAIAYKEFFPLLKDNKVFIGYCVGSKSFRVNDDFENSSIYYQDGVKYAKFGNICWFTNLDLDKSHEPLILTKNYKGNEDRYPKYDNYDAIECGKVKDIPKDYSPCWYECPHATACEYAKTEGKARDKALCDMARNGEIGVPITYLAQHCPDQMEVIGADTELACPQLLNNGKTGTGRFYISDSEAVVKSDNDFTDESASKKKDKRRLYSRLVVRRKKTV